jgi:hypothetical protein
LAGCTPARQARELLPAFHLAAQTAAPGTLSQMAGLEAGSTWKVIVPEPRPATTAAQHGAFPKGRWS